MSYDLSLSATCYSENTDSMESSLEKVEKYVSIRARRNKHFDELKCDLICEIDEEYKLGSEQCLLLSKKASFSKPIKWLIECKHFGDIEKLLLDQPQCYKNFLGNRLENTCLGNYDPGNYEEEGSSLVMGDSGSGHISGSRFSPGDCELNIVENLFS